MAFYVIFEEIILPPPAHLYLSAKETGGKWIQRKYTAGNISAEAQSNSH